MKTRFLIDVTTDEQHVSITGNPSTVLIELTSLLCKHKELSFILEQAFKFKVIMEQDYKIFEALHSDNEQENIKVNSHSAESFAFIVEFLKHYK